MTAAAHLGPDPVGRVHELVGPDLQVGRRRVPAFRLFALTGVVLAIAATLLVSGPSAVSRPAVLAVAVVAGLGSLTALAIRAARGSSDWVWHEHEAIVLTAACLVGAVRYVGSGRPLALLDVVMTGLLVLLGVGRIGCLLAGCCHGRTSPRRAWWQVRYGPAYAEAGLRADHVGVPLVPIQAMEAIGALLLAAGCLALSWWTLPPGAILVVALGGRAGVRLVLERWRGDRPSRGHRPSTPQRWSIALIVLLVLLSAISILPVGPWTVVPAAALVLGIVAVLPTARRSTA